jgi:pyrroline-5-carboxylate reductase
MQGTTINDLENLVPLAAKVVRILPSTLLLALGLLHLVA